MAFNRNFDRSAANQSNDDWKADAFLNIYLPTAGGKRVKLGAFAFKSNKPTEKALMDMFASDPEGTAKKIAAAMVLEYRDAAPGPAPVFEFA